MSESGENRAGSGDTVYRVYPFSSLNYQRPHYCLVSSILLPTPDAQKEQPEQTMSGLNNDHAPKGQGKPKKNPKKQKTESEHKKTY